MSKDLQVDNFSGLLSPPAEPEQWDYDSSVKKVSVFTYKWKNLTADIANELYIACIKLSRCNNSDRAENGKFAPGGTNDPPGEKWADYCMESMNRPKRTINRWLTRWFGVHPTKEGQITAFKYARKLLDDGVDRRTAGKKLKKYVEDENLQYCSYEVQKHMFSLIQKAPKDVLDKVAGRELSWKPTYNKYKKPYEVSPAMRKQHKAEVVKKGYSEYQYKAIKKAGEFLKKATEAHIAYLDFIEDNPFAREIFSINGVPSNGNGKFTQTVQRMRLDKKDNNGISSMAANYNGFRTIRPKFNKATNNISNPFIDMD